MDLFQSKNTTKFLKFLFITAGVITVFAFLTDLKNTLVYWGGDLRNRIVGARLLIEGMDPYFDHWHQGMSEKLLDPLDSARSITTRVSVTPTVLSLQSIMAGLPYIYQKLIWLIVQWGAFLSTLVIFYKRTNNEHKRILLLIISWFFLNSFTWRYHVNTGQLYVIYVFFLSLSWFLLHQPFKYCEILSGLLIGFTVSLRPPFILFFIPFLIYRKWTLLVSGISGLLFGFLLPFIFMNFSIWNSYFLAVTGMTQSIKLPKDISSMNPITQNPQFFPKIVEGMDRLRLYPKSVGFPDSSFKNLFKMINLELSSKYFIAVAIVIIFLFSFLFFIKYIKKFSINQVFLSVIVLYLMVEFFIPIARYPYYDIQWILPLFLIVEESNPPELLSNKLIMFLLVGMLLSLGSFNWIYKALHLSVYLIAFYVIVTSVNLIKEKRISPVNNS